MKINTYLIMMIMIKNDDLYVVAIKPHNLVLLRRRKKAFEKFSLYKSKKWKQL